MRDNFTVQFGHSEVERLALRNFDVDSDTYSADADMRVGRFAGAVRLYGRVSELEELHKSLQQMSQSLSGEVEFQNLEQQLTLHCSVGTLGGVHMRVRLRDYDNEVDCSFDTDPTSLDSTIASLAIVISRAGRPIQMKILKV